jgi:hypothetical protein
MALLLVIDSICVGVCRTAKVWKGFQLAYELKGHQQSVWAVKAIGDDEFLTGVYMISCLLSHCGPIYVYSSNITLQARQTRPSNYGNNTNTSVHSKATLMPFVG